MKRTVKFLDSDRNLVIVNCEITERNGYREFTMSGEYNGSVGQCFDSVKPDTEEQQKLIDIWHEWHLNGTKPGTDRQIKLTKGLNYEDSLKKLCNIDRETGKKSSGKSYYFLDSEVKKWKKEIDTLNDWYKSELLKMNSKTDPYYSETLEKYTNNLEEFETEFKSTLVYDVNPETGELFKYGSGWLKKTLPEGFENDLNELLDEISEHYHSDNDIKITKDDSEFFEDFNNPETVHALALMLELSTNEIQDITEDGDNRYCVQGTYYLAGTEDEMNKETEGYISENIWAFNPSFLSGYGALSDMNYADAEDILKPIQERCESGNDAIKALVKWDENKEKIVQEAILSDGRGHLLDNWNGSELECCLNDVYYFAYRN